MRKTKIVATLGPASNDLETIKKLIVAGLDAARINFSHGNYESHTMTVEKLKAAREELNAPIPLILDTKGPEIRIKKFAMDTIELHCGDSFTLTTRDIIGDENCVAVTYADFAKDIKVGNKVLIDDGLIELTVRSISGDDVECLVVNNGSLSANKGVNLPDVYVNLPSMTEKDEEDLKFGIKMGFDFIAASFVRTANDVLKIREVTEDNGGGHLKIIAKIENREGVKNIDSILEVADGIMVARGDLGVEIPPDEVPIIQKHLIKKANEKGKLVITATQMLESMVNNPRPTRAEANDVANAIYDGSDAIMLSGETAKGMYPVESIKMMAQIACTTEASIDYNMEMVGHHRGFHTNITNAISFAACTTAADLETSCIVAITDTGFTPKMISRFRPECPIVAVTQDSVAHRQLNLTWGCKSMFADDISDGNVFAVATEKAIAAGVAKNGDYIVIALGSPVGVASTTNMLKVQAVGNVLTKGKGYSFGPAMVSGRSNVIKVIEEAEKFFSPGDILVTTTTTNEMMPYLKKASAIVVGSWEKVDNSHAEIVAKALDKPLLVCNVKVVDLIPDGLAITVDTDKGFVYDGIKDSCN